MKHADACECEICNAPDRQAAMAEVERKEKAHMEKLGWYAHIVPDDDQNSPTGFNYHTHGCDETWSHRDFQIVAMIPAGVAHNLAGCAIDQLKEGKHFTPGERSDKIIQGFNVMFAQATECGREVFRIILPGPNGELEKDKMDESWAVQWEGATVVKIRPWPDAPNPN